jgi:hypothetical protein
MYNVYLHEKHVFTKRTCIHEVHAFTGTCIYINNMYLHV